MNNSIEMMIRPVLQVTEIEKSDIESIRKFAESGGYYDNCTILSLVYYIDALEKKATR